MNIMHVVPTYLPAVRYGGPIFSVHALCRSMKNLGHEVQVCTTSVDGTDDSDVPLQVPVDLDGVKVWYARSHVGRRLFYAPGMRKTLRERIRDFDIVHLHSVFLWPTWAAAFESRRAGVPYVLSPRGMLDKRLVRRKSRWLKNAWISLIEKRNVHEAGMLHVTSKSEEEQLRHFGFRLPAVMCIPNGVEVPGGYDVGRVSPDIRETISEGDYVLYLGRIHWKKGLDRLVDAWSDELGCRLVIAGNDDENYASALLPRMEKKRTIDLLARTVSNDDKEALFANARAFVLPSYSENFGNTVLEAMIRGLPVLVTEEVGASEVVTAAGGGYVVRADTLRVRLEELVSDPEEARKVGKRGQAYVMEHCNWDSVASEMIGCYENCLEARRSQGAIRAHS